MEIIARSPHRLELGYRQDNLRLTVAVATLFGLAFLGFGIWGIFAGRQKVLKCVRLDAESVECELKSSGIIGSQTIKVAKVEKAEIIRRRNVRTNRDRRTRNVYGVVIAGESEKISISGVSTSKMAAKRAEVRRINSFINDNQQFLLTMQEDGRWLGLIVGSIFTTVGSIVIYALWQIRFLTTAVFDTRLGLLRIQKTSLYGQTEKRSWNLKEINGLFLEELDVGDSIKYSVNLKLSSSPEATLTLFKTEHRSEAEAIVTAIRQFLN